MTTTQKSSKLINLNLLITAIILGMVIVWLAVRLLFPDSATILAGNPPETLGVSEQRLAPCPSSPNCVNSQSSDAEHSIKPLVYQGSSELAIAESAPLAIATLKQIINNQERTKIVTETDRYLYAQFTSRWMGFVDDVEFFVNEDQGVIDVRSASRLGESDLGVNRQRIEQIRQLFNS